MGKNNFFIYALLLVASILLIPPLIEKTSSRISRGAEIPPYTQVVPVTTSPGPTTADVHLDTFEFVTVTPTPPTATGAAPTTLSGGPIVDWAQKIANNLQKGGNSLFSKMLGEVCNGSKCAHKKQGPASSCTGDVENCYWCTWLIIDAYNLAGYPVPQELGAVNLLNVLKGMSGFGEAGASGIEELKKVKPGWAIGFGGSGHIGIVKSIEMDTRGNGKIVTIESNSNDTSHTWPIVSGTINKGGGLPIIGFAGPEK